MTMPLTLSGLHLGQRFISGTHRLTAEEIKAFARQFDPQPFHLDEHAAKGSIFHGLVASGWHTASVCMRLIVESVRLECGIIGLGGSIRWLQPARPGTEMRVESEIAEIKPSQSKPGQAVVTVNCVVRDENNAVLIELSPKLMVFGKGN